MLVKALSQCHMAWYLHLAATTGTVVITYSDHAYGVMTEEATAAGQFETMVLRPHVTITAAFDPVEALQLHSRVPDLCFIPRSVINGRMNTTDAINADVGSLLSGWIPRQNTDILVHLTVMGVVLVARAMARFQLRF